MANFKQYELYYNKTDNELKHLANVENDSYAQFVYGFKLISEIYDEKGSLADIGNEYIERAIANGCAEAEVWKANNYLNPELHLQTPTLQEEAISLLKSAILKGNFIAAISLGYMHFNSRSTSPPEEATHVWSDAIKLHQESQKNESYSIQSSIAFSVNLSDLFLMSSSLAFCAHLSDFFTDGSYGTVRRGDIAGNLNVLSLRQHATIQKEKDVIATLLDLEQNKPDLFQDLKSAGLQCPTSEEMRILLENETTNLAQQKNMNKQRRHICNSLHSVMNSDYDIRKEVSAYLIRKLPAEIANIPNLTLDLVS